MYPALPLSRPVGRDCFFDGTCFRFLCIEEEPGGPVLWFAARYPIPPQWTRPCATYREQAALEWRIARQLNLKALPRLLIVGNARFFLRTLHSSYTDPRAGDPAAAAFGARLAAAGLLPRQWRSDELLLIRLGLRGVGPLPEGPITFCFRPTMRTVLLERSFSLEMDHPAATVLFPLEGRSCALEVVQAELAELPQEEGASSGRRLVLSCRIHADRELRPQVYLKQYLDGPQAPRSSGLGFIYPVSREFAYIEAGDISLPMDGPLELELFSVSWEEPPQPPFTL
ncbi:hypothetical protein KQI82_02030 [Oscillibacter sp. MSJ-2]|uniref:Uncharacterized protein n=1 Tax=Dysosmobacter acutus TaxID=2841504 RepID=A0ABS6F5Y8_9FIRM|nr:hypothetical protein [Dysosmobacter acutus]MBU5625712.1 hypothetical protein [Dysosmobacter acutus]